LYIAKEAVNANISVIAVRNKANLAFESRKRSGRYLVIKLLLFRYLLPVHDDKDDGDNDDTC